MKTFLNVLASTLVVFLLHGANKVNAQCNQSCLADAGSDKSTGGCCGVTIGGSSNCSVSGSCPSRKTFSWAPSTGLSCTTCCNPTASPATTTTYTLTVTFSCGQGSGAGNCCCDGCSGTNCNGPTYCSGNVIRTDQVTVTINGSDPCCRMINPKEQKEISNPDVYLFPNPTNGFFTLSVMKLAKPTSVYIYDINGKGVWSSLNIDPDQKHIPINLSGQAKGVYFISIVEQDLEVVYFNRLVIN